MPTNDDTVTIARKNAERSSQSRWLRKVVVTGSRNSMVRCLPKNLQNRPMSCVYVNIAHQQTSTYGQQCALHGTGGIAGEQVAHDGVERVLDLLKLLVVARLAGGQLLLLCAALGVGALCGRLLHHL